jgi:hypothetical protein
MQYVLGVDEAGYGPKLGPLVISGTLWSVPDEVDAAALHEYLPSIALPPDKENVRAGKAAKLDVKIADSKQLYRPRGSLAALELGVLAALAVCRRTARTGHESPATSFPDTWRKVFAHCDRSCSDQFEQIAWYRQFDRAIPMSIDHAAVSQAAEQLQHALDTADVQLLQVQSRVVVPGVFNARIAEGDNKATALSGWTLELVRELIRECRDAPLLIQGDKHGGRNRYGALLQHYLTDDPILAVAESAAQSIYTWGNSRRVEARFAAKGDRFLPSALASMTSKYLRELAMSAFNAFWCERMVDLRPTAGYGNDATRFRRQIAQLQRQLQVPDDQLWRMR